MNMIEDRKKKLQPLMDRLKILKKEISQASEQLASDQGVMKVYEAERDQHYARCREIGYEPDDLDEQINIRIGEMDRALARIENRVKSLSDMEGDEDENV